MQHYWDKKLYEKLKQYALLNKLKFKENFPLKTITSFKTGGNIPFIYFPKDENSLSDFLRFIQNKDIPLYIFGNCSNILISDKGLFGVAIKIASDFSDIKYLGNGIIFCQSGISMKKLCLFALEHGLSGLEFAYGIPGTAGGAAFMNAGAYGGEIKDVLYKCTHLKRTGEKGSFENDELKLSYRHSIYSENNYIITGLYLKLTPCSKEQIKSKMDENLKKRKDKQPLEYPSAGSTFKRPTGYFAGTAIEECGLKGFKIGGAEVSKKHAGFIINKDNATTEDIKQLIEYIQKTVLEKKGIALTPEVRYYE